MLPSLRLRCCSLVALLPAARALSFTPLDPALAMAAPSSALHLYTAALQDSPLATKVATAATLAILGDALAQRRDGRPYNLPRAASFVLFDAAYRGGFQHLAFPLIIDLCRGDALRSLLSLEPSLAAAVECTAFNQLLVVPIVYYPLFFSITGAVQGLTLRESFQRAQRSFVELTLRNWWFWIPAQFIQFAFVSIEWQVPYTCAMGLVWNVILSAAAGSARDALPIGKAAPIAAPPVGKGGSRHALGACKDKVR
ncbi:hypothetical protein AB1Y20_014254 [Prymnesium parvum]|uniref:Peroxisomal membrane protein MPV17 n=1 Tax=Prymnesium parvum TaxID=97485 RepID=A0AB34IH51_PRYPA